MIVVDASAALAALTVDGQARGLLSTEQLHAPHLIDIEAASALRRLEHSQRITVAEADLAASAWLKLAVTKHSHEPVLPRVWELRHNCTPYDVAYVALAEALECPLVTLDARLARSPGTRCAVTVIPN